MDILDAADLLFIENLSNRNITDYCYQKVCTVNHIYKCKLCKVDKFVTCHVSKSGYGKLMQHLNGPHGKGWQHYVCRINKGINPHIAQQDLSELLDPYSTNVYNWMNLMAKLDIPFAWTSDKTFLNQSKFKSIDDETLQKHMINTGLLIEKNFAENVIRYTKGVNIGKVKPFGAMLDMWDDGAGRKDLAVWIVWPNENYKPDEEDTDHDGVVKVLPHKAHLLCLTPLLDMSTSSGDSQIATITEALLRVGLTWEDLLFINADNTNVNPSIARKVKKPLIGCRSHIIALGVESLLTKYKREKPEDHMKIIDRQAVQLKMRNSKYRGRLRQLNPACELTPFILGHKWPATYNMLVRYLEMKPSIGNVLIEDDIPEEDAALRLSVAQNNLTERVKEELEELMQVEKIMQTRGINPYQGRVMFDSILNLPRWSEDDLALLHHLRSDDRIIMDPIFDNALIKIIAGKEAELTVAEKHKVTMFRKRRHEDEDADNENHANFGLEILKRAKMLRMANKEESEYINLDWIPCTTCEVERTFSVCKHIYSEFRKAMSPEILEILIYLRLNRESWDINTVAQAVRTTIPK